MKKSGFTLAEVLITLAVIGVVAALTIPTLINKYNQNVAETRLKMFYSMINQAIQLSEIDNGDKKTWGFEFCTPEYSKECIVLPFEKYFKPYLKINGYEFIENFKYTYNNNALKVDFQNGSTVLFTYGSRDVIFYPVGSHYNDEKYQTDGKDRFKFHFYTSYCKGNRCKYFLGKGFEPDIGGDWDGNEENLPCLKKAQLNGWKFPDDCNPWK